MKHFLSSLVSGLFISCSVAAAQDNTLTVENTHLKLVFAEKPVPHMQQLIHKKSGINLISETANQNLFGLEAVKPAGGTISILSEPSKDGSINVSRTGKTQHINIRVKGLGSASNITVNLEGMLDDNDSLTRWSISVDNPSTQKLAAIRFPYISAVPAIGSADDDFIVAPASPGALIENPAKNWPTNYSISWPSPGIQSMQFCSFQDRSAGIYLASMDTTGHGRDLRISKQGNKKILLYHEYKLSAQTSAQWKSPYEVAFGVTSGTWQQTADIYKRWAIQQPWCAKTLVQRDDIPAFWKKGPCIHTCEVRTYDEHRLCNGSYYPKLLEHMKSLRTRIDGPVVPMLPGWENYRRWTAGAYFPIFDTEQAKKVLKQINNDGFRPFVYLSGLFYTFQNEGRDGGDVQGWERYADSLVIDAGTGKTKTFLLNESSPGKENVWKRHSYEFCPAAPRTREFFCSVIDQLHALGIDIVQMDQTVSGAGSVCASTNHGHAPGPGLYQSQAFCKLMADLRQHGKSLSPDFMFAHEELHEELIPYMDTFHTREYRERYWYRSAPGARGIPLFTYIYHEYAIAYGGEGPGASASKNPAIVRELAVNLVTGKTPAVSVWSNQKAMAEAHPDQIHMLRNHMRLLKTEAQRFLILGRMLYPLEFEAPIITLKIGAKTSTGWKQEPFEERAVLTSSWQSPEGMAGHCLVNITSTNQSVKLHLDTRNVPGWPSVDIDLYRADKPDAPEQIFRKVSLPKEYKLELAPLEAVFFVIRPVA